jgi:hypothetical protein
MTISLHLIRLVKDNQENIAKERLESMAKGGEKETVIPTLKILSPETIRRNVSNDNFLKFQWPWTV